MTLLAFLIDKFFGEFNFIKHPIIFMGDYIKWFEKNFYKDSIYRGFILLLSLLLTVYVITYFISIILNEFNPIISLIIMAIIASTTIASNMLYNAVYDISINPKNIKYLVSRDTDKLSISDINKASIETYGENLSDGVIAPLFYLYLFGIEGAFLYKAINTLDSMVGYHTDRYENFGKVSAKLDDIANFIPSRLTAILITAVNFKAHKFYKYASGHESPNAGYPISAMALAIGVKLGGDSSYFGKIKKKPFFGNGKDNIEIEDIYKALIIGKKIDILIIFILIIIILN